SFFSYKFSIVPVSFALLLFMTGCLDNDSHPTPQPVAYVNIYHASPDANDLAILINSKPITNSPFEYSDYTGYLPFHPGTRKLQFAEAGDISQVALDTSIQLVNNKMYSVFIANTFPGL